MAYFVDPIRRPYDVRALIDVYVYTKRADFIHPDFGDYYLSLLRALEAAFGLRMSNQDLLMPKAAFWNLFDSTVRSLLQIWTPWSGYLESGLLIRKLEEAGDLGKSVLSSSRTIGEAAGISRDAHLEMLCSLFTLVHGKIDKVISSADLLRSGFDDSKEPKWSDYDHLW